MNHLEDAKSPYLLQHRSNPVDWYSWGDEAFRVAAERDVPVFLSIGYATCHWCHVMEHESFEDPDVAKLMNASMVSIKVDREERPDIDDVYMTVCHLMGKQGGWPLTIIMTPEKRPFYAATYLPKQTRFGRLGMMDLIPRVAEMWRDRRTDVLASADEVTRMLEAQSAVGGASAHDGSISRAWIEGAWRDLSSRFDATFAGFGGAPKFPSPHNLSFLFRLGEPSGVAMARQTLKSMWRGGIFDQVGYGFHRYSTDSEWRLPHFEKMLHDQATMMEACVDGFLVSGDRDLKEIGLQVAEYVLRDLTHPEGGFYSAEDADSEGEEGRFYVWSQAELERVLGADAPEAIRWFTVSEEGNYLDEATRAKTGMNVLHPGPQAVPPDEAVLARIQSALLAVRSTRVRPLRDEKVLSDWNGLMIGALARAGRAFGAPHLTEAAARAHAFVRTRLCENDQWLHRWFDGDAAVPAMLDDYAFLGSGLVELFQATSDPIALEDALDLADRMIALCGAEDGGFYRSSSRGEALLVRKQDWYDGAMPAGVSAAMGLLLRLAQITGRSDLEERAAALVGPAARILGTAPGALTGFLAASNRGWGVSREIVVVADDAAHPLVEVALGSENLAGVSFRIPASGAEREALMELIPPAEGMTMVEGEAAAYVCRDFACQRPVTEIESLRAVLNDAEA